MVVDFSTSRILLLIPLPKLKQMIVEYLSFTVTFIISSGLAVLGILVSYQLYQTETKPVLQTLLYQQIFIFSFFIYGIWGNIIIREIVADLNLNAELNNKLAIFVPVLGIPFLMVSWFMHLKFGYNLGGRPISKNFVYSYFLSFIIVLPAVGFVFQNGIIQIPKNPDHVIIRGILLLNLVVQLGFVIPLLYPKENTLLKQFGVSKKIILLYIASVLIYSAGLCFFDIFGYISTCVTILLLFAAHTFFPLYIKTKLLPVPITTAPANMDFQSFCIFYEISRREAEIILEICTGKSNKAISDKLFITLQTVKDHTHRIYTKTGVKSRVQLANLVREKTGV